MTQKTNSFAKLLPIITLAFCETLEERKAKYQELGLSEDEINKLLLELPDSFKFGDKLFTQENLTKARADERRKVEGNYKQQTTIQQPPVTQITEPTAIQTGVLEVGLSKEEVMKLVNDQVAQALDVQKQTYETQINGLKTELDSVHTAYTTDKQKQFEKRKAELEATLPENAKGLLRGDNLDDLEASYAQIKTFIDATTQEAQATKTAEEEGKKHEATVFYKAEDGTEYMSVGELVKNIEHLNEWKAKQK